MKKQRKNDWKWMEDSFGFPTFRFGNSYGNLLSEVGDIIPSCFSKCKVYYSGFIGHGTAWEYYGGGKPFELEITPEQAYFISRLNERFTLYGVITGEAVPDEFEKKLLQTIPEPIINRYPNGRVELSSYAQTALYDFYNDGMKGGSE